MKLTASLGLKCGPPFKPTNDWPSTVNSTVSSSPALADGLSFADALPAPRSEEHTSELQSLMRISYAVFCLKKNITKKKIHSNMTGTKTNISNIEIHLRRRDE